MTQYNLICATCESPYDARFDVWRCARCAAGPLEPSKRIRFDKGSIIETNTSLWRYRAMLPVSEKTQIVSLGEGMTPLIKATFAGKGTHFKLEYISATGSFKDRGTTVLVTKLLESGVRNAADDSSGNAGSSLAAYCAAAGIEATIFAPEHASPLKLAQIEIFGATLVPVAGQRAMATVAVEDAVRNGAQTYATHAWSPFVHEGMKTIAYEIWEQLGRTAPDWFISPIGQGSLFLGAYSGFKDLVSAGLIARVPRMFGVQSERCAPIVHAMNLNLAEPPEIGLQEHSVAEGIAIAQPVRGRQILEAIRLSGGDAVAVSDNEIKDAYEKLAQIGFYVEPTSAVVGAALKRLQFEGVTVAALTGSGLKTPMDRSRDHEL